MTQPTDADRQRARDLLATFFDVRDLAKLQPAIAAAIAAARAEALEQCAAWHEAQAVEFVSMAEWMGPERAYVKGIPPNLIDWSPMNSSALTYKAVMAEAAAIRNLKEPGHGK